MAQDNAFGGDFLFPSNADGLPAFFTNGSVDDTKYESLLADLRAHDLLGPVESNEDSSPFGAGGSSSLFFNDAFSAVFMGNFNSESAVASTAKTSKPPPGFARPPPGLASSETDLKWARGQQEFSRIEEKFHSTSSASPGRNDDGDVFDASQILSLKSLGLDDDDAPAPVQHQHQQTRQSAPSPPPQAPPLPPSAPPAPPAGPWQNPNQHAPPLPPGSAPIPPQQYPPNGPPPMHAYPPPPPHGRMMLPYPPPPPPPFMGGPGPYGPPPMGMQMPPPPAPTRFKMMTPRDINFVVQQQMKQIRTSDPFSDDYYFHNYVQKRTRAVAARGPAGARPALPLPSWKLEHVKSIDPRDAQRATKSRNWENEFHVLGRNAKSSLYRPKQLLNLSGSDANDVTAVADESSEAAATSTAEPSAENAPKVLKMDAEHSRQSVFANESWHRRQQIDRGMHCLLSLQDARHILDARGVNVQQFHSIDEQEIDPALAELRHRTTTLLLELAALLGVVMNPDSPVMQCDVNQLHAMLSVEKGKKLVSRALPLLHPSARFMLLPHVVEFVLSVRNAARFAIPESSETEGDDKLCQALVLVILYHPPTPPAELLAESLQRAMDGHNLDSLRLLLHNRSRAEALQSLLQRGGTAIAQAPEPVQQQWNHFQGMFVSLATAIKQTA